MKKILFLSYGSATKGAKVAPGIFKITGANSDYQNPVIGSNRHR